MSETYNYPACWRAVSRSSLRYESSILVALTTCLRRGGHQNGPSIHKRNSPSLFQEFFKFP